MLFDHFEEGTILNGGENRPWIKLSNRCEEVVIKKVFHLTHKEHIKKTKEGSIKKTREAVTPRLDTVKLFASKSYIERS